MVSATHEKEKSTVGTDSMSIICSMHIALWEGKAQTEELCLEREGVNAAKCL